MDNGLPSIEKTWSIIVGLWSLITSQEFVSAISIALNIADALFTVS